MRDFFASLIGTFAILAMVTAVIVGLWIRPTEDTPTLNALLEPAPSLAVAKTEPQKGRTPRSKCQQAVRSAYRYASHLNISEPVASCFDDGKPAYDCQISGAGAHPTHLVVCNSKGCNNRKHKPRDLKIHGNCI